MASSSPKHHKIQLLPEHIIDQIKAGEVIERPSTLLKELLENSIDAGSSEIEIEIINNGLDLLSVKDNGSGIPFEDLDLAFCRHATSKIEKFEDIYNLFTYGFRGEALASIAAVSKLTCVSSAKDAPEGLIKINGGQIVAHDQDKEAADKTGTSMFIRDLFYNTPARMKFIQSKTSEKNQLDKIVKAFLLTQPEVKITVKWDEQDKSVYPARPREQLKERVEDTIKKNRPINLLGLGASYDDIHFKVFLSRESSRGNAGKAQFIFVNDRLIQDVQIHKVIINSAQNLWPQGESGHYCAYINLPAERLDVNIHPNKTQVKFYEGGKVLSLISGSIKDGLTKNTSLATPSRPSNLELPDVMPAPERKEMEYRRFDFDSGGSSLESYFQNLDAPSRHSHAEPNRQPEFQTLINFGEFSLIKHREKIYAIKTPELMSAWFSQSLASGDKSPTPLLVSQPLDLTQRLAEADMIKLGELGFEVDQIGPDDYVLRTFPNCLKSFPFREYLQAMINLAPGGADFLKRVGQIRLEDQSQWQHHHAKAMESLGITELVKLNIAVELTKEKVKKLL